MTVRPLDAFYRGYRDAMLWANCWTEDGDELDFGSGDATPLCRRYARRLTPEARATMREDCKNFLDTEPFDGAAPVRQWIAAAIAEHAPLTTPPMRPTYSWEQAGHDFALTRNGHGAGFWDRGLGDVGEVLTEACKPYGSATLYALKDGSIHHD